MAAKWTQFYAFCPLGESCKKGGKRLKNCATEDDARESVFNHLTSSSYHYETTTAEEARALALTTQVEREDVEQPETYQSDKVVDKSWRGSGGGKDWSDKDWSGKDWSGKGGKDWSSGQGKSSGSGWRSGPYETSYEQTPLEQLQQQQLQQQQQMQEQQQQQIQQLQEQQQIALVKKAAKPLVPASVLQSIARCESAARTAGRMARAAAQAFEEEASIMQMQLKRLADPDSDS